MAAMIPDEPDADMIDAAAPSEVAETAATPRASRRLPDKIMILFHQACDQREFDVAEHLLRTYEFMLNRRDPTADLHRRRSLDSLVAAHERLWYLRHPEQR